MLPLTSSTCGQFALRSTRAQKAVSRPDKLQSHWQARPARLAATRSRSERASRRSAAAGTRAAPSRRGRARHGPRTPAGRGGLQAGGAAPPSGAAAAHCLPAGWGFSLPSLGRAGSRAAAAAAPTEGERRAFACPAGGRRGAGGGGSAALGRRFLADGGGVLALAGAARSCEAAGGGRRSPAGAGGTRLRPASALPARAPGAPQPGEYAPAGALPAPLLQPRPERRAGPAAWPRFVPRRLRVPRSVGCWPAGRRPRRGAVSRPRGAASAGQSSVTRGSRRNRSGLCPCRLYGRGRCGGAAGWPGPAFVRERPAALPGLSGLPGEGSVRAAPAPAPPRAGRCAARGSAAGSGELIHGCGFGLLAAPVAISLIFDRSIVWRFWLCSPRDCSISCCPFIEPFRQTVWVGRYSLKGFKMLCIPVQKQLFKNGAGCCSIVLFFSVIWCVSYSERNW